jgi:hypothetical protein
VSAITYKPVASDLQQMMCLQKRRYVSALAALDVAVKHADGLTAPYYCGFCCGWHNGKNKTGSKARYKLRQIAARFAEKKD